MGRPQANYVLADFYNKCNVRFRFIDYNFESFARDIEKSLMPKNDFVGVIRTDIRNF